VSIVLASTSPYRRSLLESAGIYCESVDPAVDEALIVGVDPVDTAMRRARAKAESVRAMRGEGSWILGADQVVHLDGHCFDKPGTAERHRAALRRLRGRRHELATAVTLLGPERVEFVERTYLTMRADLSDDELERYVATGEGRQCAGGYQVEALGVLLFSQIEGCWTNVLGLPMPALVTALRSQGWRGL
jgi:septum formation protein